MSMLATALTAKPGMEAELHHQLLALAPYCLAKVPGCLHFIVLRDPLNPKVIHALETHKDNNTFDARIGTTRNSRQSWPISSSNAVRNCQLD